MALDLSNYELAWPSELFATEGSRVARSQGVHWEDRVVWLLTEALVGSTAVSDFKDTRNIFGERNSGTSDAFIYQKQWITELIDRANELPHSSQPRPYWPQRQKRKTDSTPKPKDARKEFFRLISNLDANGYLIESFGQECVDDDDPLPIRSEVIEDRLGIPSLWPLSPDSWDTDTFYGLIEVFHDLVSRPRRRSFHSWDECGWHYSEFHSTPARFLYRWKINQLLKSADIEHELASEGEDVGRLVVSTDEPRSDLVHRALVKSPDDARGTVSHAISLFRSRRSSAESKRSAIVALAGILEERRELIRVNLGKKDEGDLFQIANNFNLRHRRSGQKGDYNEAFLDWIFWWYLATIDLTNKIISTKAHAEQDWKIE